MLLVHGYCCNRGLWRRFAPRLAKAGHPLGAVDLEPPFGSIDRYPDILEAGIDRLRQRTGAERVALVGHSMGGLAIRAYLAREGWQHIAGVATIGSPHRGTRIASLSPARNARQMRIGSRWLAQLAAREAPPPAGAFTVILSHHDNIVTPQSGQTIPGATTIEVSGVGHMAMLDDHRVQAAVLEALDRADSVTAPAHQK
ncbi:MAG: alpha/beta fold hydrolase [Burkholderiaceae bacterium]